MRIACIGDLHGVDRWKEVTDLQVDHIVFVGDYVDSHTLSDETILKNFKEILAFKAGKPDEVTLLLGNHDIHYLYFPKFRSTGFRDTIHGVLQELFQSSQSSFLAGRAFGNYIFTHAGLSRQWATTHLGPNLGAGELAHRLNAMQKSPEELNKLAEIGVARGGTHGYGGPFWCDYRKELVPDPYPGINQVVGHTQSTFLMRNEVGGNDLIDVNYLAYSEEPIFILELDE